MCPSTSPSETANSRIRSPRYSSPGNFSRLIDLLREKFGTSYLTIERLFSGERVDPTELLNEALDLLTLLRAKSDELQKAYFFAALPKDFDDVVSLIGGGASSMTIPAGSSVYELTGGFGAAIIKGAGRGAEHYECSQAVLPRQLQRRLDYPGRNGPRPSLPVELKGAAGEVYIESFSPYRP